MGGHLGAECSANSDAEKLVYILQCVFFGRCPHCFDPLTHMIIHVRHAQDAVSLKGSKIMCCTAVLVFALLCPKHRHGEFLLTHLTRRTAVCTDNIASAGATGYCCDHGQNGKGHRKGFQWTSMSMNQEEQRK